jgi:hypothetical protein
MKYILILLLIVFVGCKGKVRVGVSETPHQRANPLVMHYIIDSGGNKWYWGETAGIDTNKKIKITGSGSYYWSERSEISDSLQKLCDSLRKELTKCQHTNNNHINHVEVLNMN